MKIGFIGLGNMGKPMSMNLQQDGFELTVFNRTREKMIPLQEMGVRTAENLSEAVKGQDVVITMLSDDRAVKDVVLSEDGIAGHVAPGTVLIDMSTVSPSTSEEIASICREKGIHFLDAPVSGSVNAAESRNLVFLVGGEKHTYEKSQPIFESLGKCHFYFGPAGSGEKAKLVVNLLLGVTMQGISEAVLLADRAGLERETVLDMMKETVLSSPLMNFKIPLYLKDEYPAAFALKLMAKDLGLIGELANQTGSNLPVASISQKTFEQAVAEGKGDLDMAGIIRYLEDKS
ncbi:MAG: NAD(P)-dependent oxidoreductase [Bacillaceae bacterium]|nr:NAD(P)-dependent oxidoreductase [Bacillaceae bacterium]